MSIISGKTLIGLVVIALLMYMIGVLVVTPHPSTAVSLPVGNAVSGETYAMETYHLTVAQARIIEIYTGHAWQNHGDEVNSTIKCLEKNGSWKTFKTFGFYDETIGKFISTRVFLCKEKNDYFVMVTTKFIKEGGNQIARLVTAYKVAKDVFPTIEDFITYIQTKWSAQEIQYVIQAGEQIFLSAK